MFLFPLFFPLLLLLLFEKGRPQVLTKVRPQPPSSLLSSMEVLQDCCSFVDDVEKLMSCSNSSKSMTPSSSSSSSKVAIVTYLDSDRGQFNIPDIFQFGAYMIANTAVYAELNDYSFRWLTKETGSNYQPGDARWNKVKIIDEALDPENGWARDCEYFVWMDADAIVLDLGLKIEEVGRQFPKADFICSADIRQGLLNSGFLVMRNTKWLRTFVKEWWEIVDRSVKCDQDAFDVLYERYIEDAERGKHWRGKVREKVAVLARDALNSDPPAMTNQKPFNQVLHLMGEVTPLRQVVFRRAFDSVCSVLTTPSRAVEPQLGATQSFLVDTAQAVYSAQTEKLMEAAKQIQRVEDFNDLSVSVHHLSDIYMQLGKVKKQMKLFEVVYNMTVKWQDDYENILEEKGAKVNSTDVNVYVHLLKRVAENSNDYFHSLREKSDTKRKEEVASATLLALDRLFENVGPESKPFARHMSALMLTNLGEMYYSLWEGLDQQQQTATTGKKLMQLVIDNQKSSVNYFAEYLEDVDNKSIQNEYSLAVQLLAIAYSHQNRIEDARQMWNKALTKSIKITGGAELGPYYSSLSTLYFNAAMCDMRGNYLSEAKEKLLQMMVVSINSGQITEDQLNARPFVGPRELEIALSMLREISMKDPTTTKKVATDMIEEEWEDCEEGEEGCEEVYEMEKSGRDTHVSDRVGHEDDEEDEDEEEMRELAEIRAQYARQSAGFASTSDSSDSATVEEDDEWEECVEGEEGCEEVEEDNEGNISPVHGQKERHVSRVTVSRMEDLDDEYEECVEGEEGCEELEVELMGDEEEDEEDEEEMRELAEIRAQYARQSAGFASTSDSSDSATVEEDDEWEECVEGEEGCEEVEEDNEGNISPVHGQKERHVSRVTVSRMEDLDDEYEECVEGEEGCEELEVELMGDEEEDEEDEEEMRELAEIRAQYARQSKEWRTASSQ